MHVSRRTSVGLAIGIAVAILYVGLSLTWHRMKWRWFPPEDLWADPSALSGDPFAALPPEVKPQFSWRERIDPVFYDFDEAWARITFPLKPWDARGRRYSIDPANSYVNFLRPMDEPSLSVRDKGDTNSYFRFLLVPSCGDDAWALRLTIQSQESATLRDIYLKDGVLKPASIDEVDVSAPVLKDFRTIIGNADFWEPLSALEKEEMALVPSAGLGSLKNPPRRDTGRSC